VKRARGDDSGVTLVELLVTMMLMSVVSGLILTAMVSTHKTLRHTDDDSQGLLDVKVVAERLGRDLRDARGIDTGADVSHLVIWVDSNSDYVKQPGEIITWQLRANAADPSHYDVLRTVQGQTDIVEARTLVNAIAFSYSPSPPDTEIVTTSMSYDAVIGTGTTTRTITFATRLRNVR
jgi:prepilin-type N-terminal cleavage/methylation domain-containing protein